MKGKAVLLTVLLGFALAQGRLEAGLYAAPPGLAPALEAGLSLEEGEVFLRLAHFRAALGYAGSLALGPLGFFAFGLQGEVGEGGEVLELSLRLGGTNRLEGALFLGEASLLLTLSYPWAGSVVAWLGDLGLEAGYEGAPYAWVRYAWRWP